MRTTSFAVAAVAAFGCTNRLDRPEGGLDAEILRPSDGEVVDPTGVVLRGHVAADDFADLEVTWSDAELGEIGTSTPEADGGVTLTLDDGVLPCGHRYIELRAVDGDARTALDGVSFTVLPSAPVVSLQTVEFTYAVGTTIALEGIVSDAGGVGGFPASWSSSLVGPIGETVSGADGSVLWTGVLDVGTHVVSLTGSATCGRAVADATAYVTLRVVAEGTGDDADGDGDGIATADGDCDDRDPSVAPDAPERCDGVDNDCDDEIDEGHDDDGDGWTTCDGDCHDGRPSVNPEQDETCNGVDDDCDGVADEDFDEDADGVAACAGDCDDKDAFIHPLRDEGCNNTDDDCDGSIDEDFDVDGDGVTTCDGDCDDTRDAVRPDAPELCDALDNDCDNERDEGFDVDRDGVTTCGGDCDDQRADRSPKAVDLCNGVDDNCDGTVDEGHDLDGDGVSVCSGDCRDDDALAFPGATERCNGRDDDCDQSTDEGFDNDDDGVRSCDGDCDDSDATRHRGARELCNDRDDDCDGAIDDDVWVWDGVLDPDCLDVSIPGAFGNENAGAAVAYVGDHDGDDLDDFAVYALGGGIPGALRAVYLIGSATYEGQADFRGSHAVVYGNYDIDPGWLRYAGDVTGDGNPDFLRFGSYRATVFKGPLSGTHNLSETPNIAFHVDFGIQWNTPVGAAVLDLDGAGASDLVFGKVNQCCSSGPTLRGVTLVRGPIATPVGDTYYPPPSTRIFEGEREGGNSVAVGDFDGDGSADLVIATRLYFGPLHEINGDGCAFTSGPCSLDTSINVQSTLYSGVDARGDLNGDGLPDLISSFPQSHVSSDCHSGPEGRVSVLFSPVARRAPNQSSFLGGPQCRAQLGQAATPVLDFNGDGLDDLAVSVVNPLAGSTYSPEVLLFLSPLRAALSVADADIVIRSTADGLGYSLDGYGDLNGDGLGDLLIGARYASSSGLPSHGAVHVLFGRPSPTP